MSKFLKRLALAILVPVLLLGACEAALRLLHRGYPTTFLVRMPVGGRGRWVDNQYYSCRFFPPRMARATAPIVMDRTKEKGTIRVYILGESAAMGEPQAEFGPAQWLDTVLSARYPQQRFEIINAAMTAINSHVIADITEQLCRYNPDVFIIYMGNNEVVGPFGPGTVFETSSEAIDINRLRVKASNLRLVQAIGDWKRGGPGERWTGMEMFEGRRVKPDDPRLENVYRDFRRNLVRMLGCANRANARVILSTMAVNLRRCAPFAGEAARAIFASAQEAERAGDIGRAMTLYRQARDGDELRFRADGRLNDIIREVGARAQNGVTLVDADRDFDAWCADPAERDGLFVDHVHFGSSGNYHLALSWADALTNLDALAEAKPVATPSREECLARMHYTPWSGLDVTESLIQRRRHAPFVDQPGNAEQLTQLLHQRVELNRQMQGASLDEVQRQHEEALQQYPGDARLMGLWAEILLNEGRFGEAEKWMRAKLALEPHRFENLAGLALALCYQGRSADAVGLFNAPGAPRPVMAADLMVSIARTLARDHETSPALALVQAAAKLAPSSVDVQLEYAGRLADSDRSTEAEERYRDLAQRFPRRRNVQEEWIAWLVLHGRWQDALSQLEKAGRVWPGDFDLQIKKAQVLLYAGKLDDAEKSLGQLKSAHPDKGEVELQLGLLNLLRKNVAAAEASFRRATELGPDARAHFQLGRLLKQRGDRAGACRSLESAVQCEPDRPEYLQLLAWMLATSAESTHAENEKAAGFASDACVITGWRDARSLDALAAAQAALGDFEKARETEGKAIEFAESEPMAAALDARLQLYEQDQPYREP